MGLSATSGIWPPWWQARCRSLCRVAVGLIVGSTASSLAETPPCLLHRDHPSGFLAGMLNRYLQGRLPGIVPAMLFAVGIELLHGALSWHWSSPFRSGEFVVPLSLP